MNEICCIKHCHGIYKQISIVNSVSADDWTTERVTIASNGLEKQSKIANMARNDSTLTTNSIFYYWCLQ